MRAYQRKMLYSSPPTTPAIVMWEQILWFALMVETYSSVIKMEITRQGLWNPQVMATIYRVLLLSKSKISLSPIQMVMHSSTPWMSSSRTHLTLKDTRCTWRLIGKTTNSLNTSYRLSYILNSILLTSKWLVIGLYTQPKRNSS